MGHTTGSSTITRPRRGRGVARKAIAATMLVTFISAATAACDNQTCNAQQGATCKNQKGGS